MTIAVIASLVFIVASFRVWAWLVTSMIERQEAYQLTRRRSGRTAALGGEPGGPADPATGKPNYYTPRRLSVFDE